MTDSDSTPDSTLLARWVESQKRLESAMEEFCNATSSIATTFATPALHSTESKDIAFTVDKYTVSINNTRERLLDASITLFKIRNEHVAPINRLTDDILQHIFRIFVDSSQPTEYFMQPPVILSSVCSIWRDVGLNTGSIWGYITFDQVNGRFDVAPLCLERASGSPLHVTIRDVGTNFETALDHTGIAYDLLTPYASRFSSFSLEVQHATTLDSLVAIWLEYGTPGTVKRVSITSHQGDFPPYDILSRSDTYRDISTLLEPIQSLHLCNVFVEWDSLAFRNLLELSLDRAQREEFDDITIEELNSVLVMSPQLHTLKLRYFQVRAGELPPSFEFRELRSLTLEIDDWEGTTAVLSVIGWPSSNPIHLTIDRYREEWKHVLELSAYWNSSYISTLRLGDEISRSVISVAQPRLQAIEALVYFGKPLDMPRLRRLSDLATSGLRFRTIEIAICMIASEEGLREMILSHQVQKLRLIMCRFVETNEAGDKIKVDANKDMDICVWLAKMVPDFEIFDHGKYFVQNYCRTS